MASQSSSENLNYDKGNYDRSELIRLHLRSFEGLLAFEGKDPELTLVNFTSGNAVPCPLVFFLVAYRFKQLLAD